MAEILRAVNEFNELLYDWIIPRLFNAMYELKAFEHAEEEEIELVKAPEAGYYNVRANPTMVITEDNPMARNYGQKSFHLDTYAFDSKPEQELFWYLLREGKVKEIYFTGMLTHGQSDFYIQYIDPDSHTVKRYYPDFLIQKDDGSWVIVEVKADHLIDDKMVEAKAKFTQQVADASQMRYQIITGSDASAGRYSCLFEER